MAVDVKSSFSSLCPQRAAPLRRSIPHDAQVFAQLHSSMHFMVNLGAVQQSVAFRHLNQSRHAFASSLISLSSLHHYLN